jgi:two-component system CheB/CheR fusion protein
VKVIPLDSAQEPEHFVVLFEKVSRLRSESAGATGQELDSPTRVAELETDLESLRTQMQVIISALENANQESRAANEESAAMNEELQSANQELQSTNEELDTAREELQATNEELHTINEELHTRNDQLSGANGDLINLLAAVNLAIVIVGADLRIRRFTPMAERYFSLVAGDVGRSITNFNLAVRCPDLVAMIRHTIDTVEVQEKEIQDDQGGWYSLRIRPYKDVDNRIDGAVLTLFDITEMRRSLLEARAARKYAEGIVETVRHPLVVLDERMRVHSANRAFFETFHTSPGETINKLLYDLGDGQWNIPVLRTLLEEVLPQKKLEDYEVDHNFPTIGRRKMLLNARRIEPERGEAMLILVAIEDVTRE